MNMDESCASSQPLEHGDAVAVEQSIENEEEVVATVESDSQTAEQTPNKYAALISNYEDVNEKLRKELNELKNRKRESKSDYLENPAEHEEAKKELAEVQNLLQERNSAFIANRLEAALWHKATSMFERESTTRKLMEGMLKLHRTGLAKLKKNIWAEIHFSLGKAWKSEYEAGYVTLTYADSKDAETFNHCQVNDVFQRESNSRDLTFIARVSSEGTEKELIFGCESELQRKEWIKCISGALAEVRETYSTEIEHYTLKLEFTKEKIGLLVKERFLTKKVAETKSREESEKKEAAKAMEKEMKVDEEERPCELMVIDIVDKDLSESGLQLDSIVKAINDTVMVGKLCTEQLDLLKDTPKPYVLTFTGRNFKKTTAPLKSCPKHGYFAILKELVAFGDNEVKEAFKAMVKGTLFEQELNSSEDVNKSISSLLGNQRRLIDLLQNCAGKEQEEEPRFKE